MSFGSKLPETLKRFFPRILLFIGSLCCFFAFLAILGVFAGYQDMTAGSLLKFRLLYTFIFALPAAWFTLFRDDSIVETIFALVITGGILYLRTGFFEHKTFDHELHIDRWIDAFKTNGIAAFRDPVWNYNLPYLYIVWLSTTVSKSYLFLKFLALPFELTAGFFAFQIVGLYQNSFFRKFLGFAVVLCLPTVILNNSFWGQCDVIFITFIIASLYCLLIKRNFWAMALWGISFAFKAQAFFILPLYFILWLHGNLRLRDFFAAPLSYLVIHLPGLLAEYPFSRLFESYLGQMEEVSETRNFLVNNAPNVYHFFAQNISTPYDVFATAGIGLTVVISLMSGFWAWTIRGRGFSGKDILLLAAFVSVYVPYFLPGMADRSFFIADILTAFALLVCGRKLLIPAIFTNFSSWMAYSYFLYGEYWVDYRLLAALNGISLIILIYLINSSFSDRIDDGSVRT